MQYIEGSSWQNYKQNGESKYLFGKGDVFYFQIGGKLVQIEWSGDDTLNVANYKYGIGGGFFNTPKEVLMKEGTAVIYGSFFSSLLGLVNKNLGNRAIIKKVGEK